MSQDTAAASQETYQEATKGGAGDVVKIWLDAINIATKDEESWRKDAENAVNLYRQNTPKRDGVYDSKKKFNILHSNIETIVPALYNSTPIPDVRRRFSDNDPVAKQVADIQERCLSYSVDAYDFDHTMALAVKDSELAGRAVARVRYKPYLSQDGNSLDYQEVTCEHVLWKYFRRGPGNEWMEVPWISFQLFLTRDELIKLSPKLGGKIKMDVSVGPDALKDDGRNVPEVFQRATVWEIWDKERRKVLFIAESYKDSPIHEIDDPLRLDGFFPIPRPIYSITTSDSLVPVVPYEIYRAQAEELERISSRIVVLTEAVKAKAIYDGRMVEMDRLESAEDADHIPLENTGIFADGSKLADHIMWYPLETIVGALKECFEAREQIKQTIYEITGISDILRGQSQASETATAQNIKQQWGSLRIQQKQAEIQRFARDLFRIKAELFATKFEPQVLQMMTGVPITPEVLQLLRSDKMRGYRVDIESDSTIRADLTRNQQNMALFLQGSAQFIQGVGPLLQQYPEAAAVVMQVYSSFSRNFKLGKQAEDALDKLASEAGALAQQRAQRPDPKMELEQQKIQVQQQTEATRLQAEQQAQATQLQFQSAESQQKIAQNQQQHDQKMQADWEKHTQEMAMREREMAMQERMHQATIHAQREQNTFKAQNDSQRNAIDFHVKSKQLEAEQNPPQEDDTAAQALKAVAEAMTHEAEALSNVAEAMAADTEIIRDKKSQLAIGSRKVLNRQ